jgi:hypothetical protein
MEGCWALRFSLAIVAQKIENEPELRLEAIKVL